MLDLDAVESGRQPFEFTFGGTEFTFPADPDIKWLEYLVKGAMQQTLYELLGEKQYEAMEELEATMTHERMLALLDAYKEHQGIDALGKLATGGGQLVAPNRSTRRSQAKSR